jgi:hypothetical protein
LLRITARHRESCARIPTALRKVKVQIGRHARLDLERAAEWREDPKILLGIAFSRIRKELLGKIYRHRQDRIDRLSGWTPLPLYI